MMTNYLKIGVRNLIRTRVLSTINIVGLSAGLAAVMFILLRTYAKLPPTP